MLRLPPLHPRRLAMGATFSRRRRPRLPTTIGELLCIFAGGYAFSPLDAALPARALLRLRTTAAAARPERSLQVQQPS